jgi:hypothetical protein
VWGPFSYEDIFVAGIGFDFAGAFLLARGLLFLSAPDILNLASSYWGFSPPEIVAHVEEKVSTNIGVAALVVGFLLQLVGYVVDLALRSASPPSSARAWVAVGVAAVSILITVAVYVLQLRPWRRRLLLDIAHYDKSGKQPYPYGHYLVVLGDQIGFPAREGEAQADYARRVWYVDRIIEGGPPG